MKTQFITYNRTVFEKSLSWLQDKEIKYLTLAPNTTIKQKEKWYNSLSTRQDYLIWGVQYDHIIVGAVGIKEIIRENASGVYWGYIGEKQYWGRGIGSEMVDFAIKQAQINRLHTLNLTVRKDNTRALALYTNKGFVKAEELDETINMTLALSDVVLM